MDQQAFHAVEAAYIALAVRRRTFAEVAAPGKGVVEAGAGTGYVCWLLAQAGLTAHAYDLYPPHSGGNRYH